MDSEFRAMTANGSALPESCGTRNDSDRSLRDWSLLLFKVFNLSRFFRSPKNNAKYSDATEAREREEQEDTQLETSFVRADFGQQHREDREEMILVELIVQFAELSATINELR